MCKPAVVRLGRNLGSLTFSVKITKIPAIIEIIWKAALNLNGALAFGQNSYNKREK